MSTAGDGLSKCKQFLNEITCKEVDGGSCTDADYYFHKNHCCEEGKYWNSNSNSCTLIDGNLNIEADCLKVDDNN